MPSAERLIRLAEQASTTNGSRTPEAQEFWPSKVPIPDGPGKKPSVHSSPGRSSANTQQLGPHGNKQVAVEYGPLVHQRSSTDRSRSTGQRNEQGKPPRCQNASAPSRPKPTMTFHKAAETGNCDEIWSHIEWGSDVDVQDTCGATPLHWAVRGGQLDAVDLLVKLGAYVNARDHSDNKPIGFALAPKSLEMAKLLVEHGADLGVVNKYRTALTSAVRPGNEKLIRWLLERGADVNEPDPRGELPLREACCFRHVEQARILLEWGADVNQVDGRGHTPLCEAVENGWETMFEFLVEHGADLNRSDAHGSTPLLLAASRPLLYAKLLLDHGANVNTCGTGRHWWPGGYAPLHMAAAQGDKDVVRLLLAHGANVDARTGDGRTPREIALDHGRKEVASLLRHGWWRWLGSVLECIHTWFR